MNSLDPRDPVQSFSAVSEEPPQSSAAVRLFELATADAHSLAISVGFLVLLVVLPHISAEAHLNDHSLVHLAAAMLDGHLLVPDRLNDTVALGDGWAYAVFPPFPALLLVPLVAVFGLGAKTLLLTPLLGAIAAWGIYKALRNLEIGHDAARWSALGLVLGTACFPILRFDIDTYFAHGVNIALVSLALAEATGKRRGILIGFLLGFAVLSRQLTVFTLPLYWLLLCLPPDERLTRKQMFRRVLLTQVGLGICGLSYMAINWSHFGSPFDTGYAHLNETGLWGYRLDRWGNFSFVYLPSNLVHLLLTGFTIEWLDKGRMIPTLGGFGSSITFSSPFLFLALRGRLPGSRWLSRGLWATIALLLSIVLLHKSSLGAWQVNGLRYTLDFLPLLILPFGYALERLGHGFGAGLAKAAVLYAIALNLLALVGIPAIHDVLRVLPH